VGKVVVVEVVDGIVVEVDEVVELVDVVTTIIMPLLMHSHWL
jgi:hypothetical protein